MTSLAVREKTESWNLHLSFLVCHSTVMRLSASKVDCWSTCWSNCHVPTELVNGAVLCKYLIYWEQFIYKLARGPWESPELWAACESELIPMHAWGRSSGSKEQSGVWTGQCWCFSFQDKVDVKAKTKDDFFMHSTELCICFDWVFLIYWGVALEGWKAVFIFSAHSFR